MTTTWKIEVDWERKGDFTGDYDDVSSRVLNANWFIGMRNPYQNVGDDSMLELLLNNADKRFSPEYGDSPLDGYLASYRPVRLQSNDGSSTRTHFIGWIESIVPQVNQYGERQVKITCAGPMQFFKSKETKIGIQANQRTDAIIDTLLNEVKLPPALVGNAIIDFPESIIGSVNVVGDTSISRSLQAGKTVLAYAADNWSQNSEEGGRNSFNVYQAIEDVAAAERGRFFFDREGQARFWHRHHLIENQTLLGTFDNSMVEMAYQYGQQGEFANLVTVNCHPRSISVSSSETLWSLEEAVTLEQGEERELNTPYKDESNNRIGGINVHLANVSFRSGKNLKPGTVYLKQKGANQSTIVIRNPYSSRYKVILESCEIQGQKITDFGQMQAQATDHAGLVRYGQRTLALNLNSVDQWQAAQGIADFELLRRKKPSGKVQSITLRSHGKNADAIHSQQLLLTIGDRIRVIENQVAHDKDYFIIGEAHKLSESATHFETMWYLESATEGNWFVVDTSEIDSEAVLLPY